MKAKVQGYEVVKRKGDVCFYRNKVGVMYQQLGSGEIYKVREGSDTYKFITEVGVYSIKYHNNGVEGFCVYKGRNKIKKGFWKYSDALAYLYESKRNN